MLLFLRIFFLNIFFITILLAKGLYNNGKILDQVEDQTDVNNAVFVIKDGVPYLDIKNVGLVFHPAWTAIYALQYAGVDSFYQTEVTKNTELFFKLLKVLEDKLVYLEDGNAVWLYDFDDTYNNVYIKAPWYSSFAQAIGVEVFITAYKETKDKKYLNLAKQVAQSLITPLKNNGLMFVDGDDVWFEEIPLKDDPTHILNAHLRSLIALDMLYESSGEQIYKEFFNRGFATLKRWLYKFDTGYWLKYDLNPNYKQLFRITNPYGFKTVELPIDSISILDKNGNTIIKEDIGDHDDFDENKSIYLSGIDWKLQNIDNNITLRSMQAVFPANFKEEFESQKLTAPYTFINVNFPKKSNNEYFLKIDYKDNIKGNLVLQQRTISPGLKFHTVDNGIFLLKGDNKPKSLITKIGEKDLGYHVGSSYAWKHYLYLNKIADITKDKDIIKWSKTAKAYINTIEYETDHIIKLDKPLSQIQTSVEPILSLYNGVIAQHSSINETKHINGVYDFKSQVSQQELNPYLISIQAEGNFFNIHKHLLKTEIFLHDNLGKLYDKYDWLSIDDADKVKKEPAIKWLKENAKRYKDALSWQFDFRNVYNDVEQSPGWNSAFGQAYVIKAFVYNKIYDYAIKAANAYKYDITSGGVSSFGKDLEVWFEEVPNKTHILNAHLISLNALKQIQNETNSNDLNKTINAGLKSLEDKIFKFDNGYWSKYDQNPKKELLFQIDYLSGEKSPLIESACLISTINHQKTCVQATDDGISGIDWLPLQIIDKISARSFENGHSKRTTAVAGGASHNVFINMPLPDREFADQWDITPYYFVLKYKDVSKGQFAVKIQAINQGNFLEFVPLQKSNIITYGDNNWKEFLVPVYATDLGWYMGVDYHKYHIEQLSDVNRFVNDLVLGQVIQRWNYYLDEFENNRSVIVEPKIDNNVELKNYSVKSNLNFYECCKLENALDGDADNNYVAATEDTKLPHKIEIDFNKRTFVDDIDFLWESATNKVSKFDISFFDGDNVVFDKNISNESQETNIKAKKDITKIVVNIKEYGGQKRLLMRSIRIFGR